MVSHIGTHLEAPYHILKDAADLATLPLETLYTQAPYFSTAAIEWLAASGMKLMGVDASGVEIPASESHENHHALFERGIPLIENVAGFDKLTQKRVQLYAFPIAVERLESFPVRVVAIEQA